MRPEIQAVAEDPFAGRNLVRDGVVVKALPGAARFVLRCAPVSSALLGEQTGWPLNALHLRALVTGQRRALRLGPDEWLLLDAADTQLATEAAFAALQSDAPHSLVDVSHRQLALSLTGEKAASLLNAGCPLDLDDAAFPIGCCTRTLLGRIEITLWKVSEDQFHIEIWRSFAQYAWTFLETACRDI